EVFNGANDNGSGSTTLLELAKVCQQAVFEGNRPDRSILFLWFCGEEKGLLGSQYYSENPAVPLANTIVDINIDMVGRRDEKYSSGEDFIYVIGSDRLSSDLHRINEDMNNKYSHFILDYTYNSETDPNRYYYRSDHYNFARKGIPAIFFFNGTNPDYHRTTDDVEKIDFDLMARTGKMIFHTMWALANHPERIVVDGEIR
ncbi:MAG: M28 family peptidase, partial [Saprospiraceae bacterium]